MSISAYPFLYREGTDIALLFCLANEMISVEDRLAKVCVFFRKPWINRPQFDEVRKNYAKDNGMVASMSKFRVVKRNLIAGIDSEFIPEVVTNPIMLSNGTQFTKWEQGQSVVWKDDKVILKPQTAGNIGFGEKGFQVWLVGNSLVEWHVGNIPCEIVTNIGAKITRLIPVFEQAFSWIVTTEGKRSFLWSGSELREIFVNGEPIGNCSILDQLCAYEEDDTILLSAFTLGEALLVSTKPFNTPLWNLAKNFTSALSVSRKGGWPTVNEAVYNARITTCRKCPYWQEDVAFGLGRCNACGCMSIKHVLATEACPKGKWQSDLIGKTLDGVFPWRVGGEILCSTDVALLDIDGPKVTEEEIVKRIKEKISSDESFGVRLYRTYKGFRAIVTSKLIPITNVKELAKLVGELKADLQYVSMANKFGCYAARLSPKTERLKGKKESAVATCEFISSFGNPVIPERILNLVTLHDEKTKAVSGLTLA